MYMFAANWKPCWRGSWTEDQVSGDSRFYINWDDESPTEFEAKKKCTIPCGGVGYLPRAKEPKYELESACSRCTKCDQFRKENGDLEMIKSQSECESEGCCRWENGVIWGGYCGASKRGDCGTEIGEYPESSDAQVLSYPGNDNEKIKCNQLPDMGVAGRQGTADKAGFELRECENPTDVCATYCVHVKASPESRTWISPGMCVSTHQRSRGSLCAATYDPVMPYLFVMQAQMSR